MTLFGVAARWTHLACGLGLVGIFSAWLLAGRSDRPTAGRWASRTLALSRGLALGALVSGLATLAHQLIVVSGRADALLDPVMWLRLLGQSHFGTVWLVRHGLLLLCAALLLFREREESGLDWTAWRLQAWALAAAAVGAIAWAGHAVAAGSEAVLVDAIHLVAAGFWLGALLPLGLLLRAASREAGADARPYAVLTVRRFSRAALAAMLLIVATGLWNASIEVGGVPALVGTTYGRTLLVKVALLGGAIALAAAGRRLLPALSGEGETLGRPAMARLSRLVSGELLLGLLVVGAAAGLSLAAPGAHDTVWWPFSYRLSYDAVARLPGTSARLVIGSQIAMLGLLALLIAPLVARRRGLLVGIGGVAIWSGLCIALPTLAVDAYPTTYVRSPLPYETQSIARGATLYAAHCAACHGRDGQGDGPAGAGLPRPPADLTAPHTSQHTAGDLFWWITHGIRAAGMPAFASTLAEDERWELITYVRALAAGTTARRLTPRVERGGPRVVAPDFSYRVGPTAPQSLKELRGRAAVLLVLFQLPGSRSRMEQLAGAYRQIEASGAEIITVPIDADPGIIARLGMTPPVFFPVVTEGAAEIASAYMLFSRTPEAIAPRHAELLIDGRGYLRARWIPGDGNPGWGDLGLLRAQLRLLDQEAPAAPALDEHIH
jgi:putative copper export protein/mono/diheme cytochrome c family protein